MWKSANVRFEVVRGNSNSGGDDTGRGEVAVLSVAAFCFVNMNSISRTGGTLRRVEDEDETWFTDWCASEIMRMLMPQ